MQHKMKWRNTNIKQQIRFLCSVSFTLFIFHIFIFVFVQTTQAQPQPLTEGGSAVKTVPLSVWISASGSAAVNGIA